MGMQDIVECVGAEDVFFDSIDLFSEVLEYEFGRNELRSVEERRDTFLSKMGFIEPSPSSGSSSCSLSSTDRGDDNVVSDRENDCDANEYSPLSGSSSGSSSSSSTDCGDDNVVVSDKENDYYANEHDQPIRRETGVSEDSDVKPSTSSSGKSMNTRIEQWWRTMSGKCKCKSKNGEYKKFEMTRTKVHVNKKRVKELSGLFEVQEIHAHKGIIWCMKFSPDGQYLATGGQDGIVRVWRVKSVDSCCNGFPDESVTGEKKVKVPVVVPDKMFRIEEQPLHEFYGHSGDVLDLAWSPSNHLLSSSTDKTVRLWHVGSDLCLNTFVHTDYVTCVQFNPTHDRYFMSGSIDGKVRIWSVSKGRVVHWADVRDAVTALCYQSDGHGFAVGSLTGTCRFYETKDKLVELSAHIQIYSRRKSLTNRITGIQFFPEDSQRVMVMSEDSKLRIIYKEGVVCKYRGLPKSGGQMPASFSSNRGHIFATGEDSRVYMWDHEDPLLSSSRPKKSNRSCENFVSEGVSVAISCSGPETLAMTSERWSHEHEPTSQNQDPLGFFVNGLFPSKNSAIWPEDMLPIFDAPLEQSNRPTLSSAWGIVIVTATRDGIIRTFHNYGLPVKV